MIASFQHSLNISRETKRVPSRFHKAPEITLKEASKPQDFPKRAYEHLTKSLNTERGGRYHESNCVDCFWRFLGPGLLEESPDGE